MKPKQQNKFVRFILRTIDVVIAFRFGRRVRWKEKPFRKATNFELRVGWFSVAFFPMLFLLMAAFDKPVDSFAVYAEHHSVLWLYAGFMAMGLFMVFCLVYIGPKVPLYFSIPVAIVASIYCVWLLGFHSEKVFNSNSNW
jgi:hypothetical protein